MKRVPRLKPLLAVVCAWAVLGAVAVASTHVETPAAHDDLSADCAACHLARSCTAIAAGGPLPSQPTLAAAIADVHAPDLEPAAAPVRALGSRAPPTV